MFRITAWIRCGMLGVLYSDPFIEAFFIASTKALALDGYLSVTFLFRTSHRFSTGLWWGLFPGHSSVVTSAVVIYFFTFWHSGTEHRRAWIFCMWIASFSLSNSAYFSPFMAVPGVRKFNPAVPELNIAPQIKWLGGCPIVDIVYFHQIFPWRLVACWVHTTNCCTSDLPTIKPYPTVPIFIFLGKIQTFEFHSRSQTWLTSVFVWFQTKLIAQISWNGHKAHICTFSKQSCMYLSARTSWRACGHVSSFSHLWCLFSLHTKILTYR